MVSPFILGEREGREWLVEELEGDMEVGMKLHLTSVIASKDITVVDIHDGMK